MGARESSAASVSPNTEIWGGSSGRAPQEAGRGLAVPLATGPCQGPRKGAVSRPLPSQRTSGEEDLPGWGRWVGSVDVGSSVPVQAQCPVPTRLLPPVP